MADDEFSGLFPPSVARMQWPQTFAGKNRTYIGGIGSASYYQPTPRDRLIGVLHDVYGDSPEARHRIAGIMERADFFASTPFGAYDATRAIGEGRYKDAVIPGITATAPFLAKPAIKLAGAVGRRLGAGSRHLAETSDLAANVRETDKFRNGQTGEALPRKVADISAPPPKDNPEAAITFKHTSGADNQISSATPPVHEPADLPHQGRIDIATDAAGLFRRKPTIGSKARPTETPGSALNEKHLASQDFDQTIAENGRPTAGRSSITRKFESSAGRSDDIPDQSFLTQGLGEMRHNYPPDYTIADDISASLDSMPTRPRNKQPRVPLHEPPTTDQRHFKEDYSTTPAHDETGRLLVDIDGDPITAQYVAGRQTLGGNDVGFDAKTLREIAKKLSRIETVPQKNLGGSFGKMVSGKGPKDIAAIQLARELPERHMDRVLAHELGHGLHKKAGLPPIIDPVMRAELERNYSRLRTGIENPKKLTLPRDVHSNYHDPVASDRELVADGYFVALAYPSYAKKALPVAYATMREWIKSNPELAKLVINNSVAAATFAAALAAAGDHDEAKAKASPSRTPQGNLPGSQGSFAPRGLPPQAPQNEKFRDIVQALVELKARREPQLYGGPR